MFEGHSICLIHFFLLFFIPPSSSPILLMGGARKGVNKEVKNGKSPLTQNKRHVLTTKHDELQECMI